MSRIRAKISGDGLVQRPLVSGDVGIRFDCDYHEPVRLMRIFVRLLRIFGLLLVLILVITGVISLNRYLAAENRLFYATGTNDKAFLNATWKMSPHEVERANHALLVPNEDVWIIVDAPSVMDRSRYKELLQNDVMLWGHSAKISYSFFDNRLVEYYVSLTLYETENGLAEIRNTLEQQFGKGKIDPSKTANLIINLAWDTPKQKLALWSGKNEGENSGYYLGIRATHKPSTKEIEEVIRAEKKTYF